MLYIAFDRINSGSYNHPATLSSSHLIPPLTSRSGGVPAHTVKDWKNKNPELVKLQQKRRRQRVLEQSDGTITQNVLAQLKDKAEFCCYCKKHLTKENITTDHAQPIGLGGLHSITNIVVCCKECNYKKGDMPLKQWLSRINQDETQSRF